MQERSTNGVKNNFFIRLCYGYVEHNLGKDTSNMTTDQVVKAFLDSKGVNSPKEFFSKTFNKKSSTEKASNKLNKISVDERWAYNPKNSEIDIDTNDLRENPIKFVGVGKDYEIGEILEEHTKQIEYKSNYEMPISKLETLQPFVLASGVDNYKRWDETEKPYVIELEGHYYLIDGNHRTAIAKLKGNKTITVDLSVRKRT